MSQQLIDALRTAEFAYREMGLTSRGEYKQIVAALASSGQAASAVPTTADSWPIVKIRVEDGRIESAEFYTPGLPDGEHDLWPVHVIYEPDDQGAPVGKVIRNADALPLRKIGWLDVDLPEGAALYATPPAPRAPSIEPHTQGAAYRATDQVLDLLVAAGHITREKAFQCRDIWCTYFGASLAAPAGAGVEEARAVLSEAALALDLAHKMESAESVWKARFLSAATRLRSYSASLGLQARTEGKV